MDTNDMNDSDFDMEGYTIWRFLKPGHKPFYQYKNGEIVV